jgi:hypothetical protein
MRRCAGVLACLLLTGGVVSAQSSSATVPQDRSRPYVFELPGLARQEWTTDLFGGVPDERRWRLRVLPRLQIGQDRLVAGIGADLNYSQDENTKLDPEAPQVLRDNYNSRSGRLDLAYLRVKPVSWLHLEGGRFPMPIGLTEMLWDADLRPQGGALRLETSTKDFERLAFTVLGAQGSHILKDQSRLLLFSAEAAIKTGYEARFAVRGSLLDFSRLDSLDPRLRRQNTTLADAYAQRYRVVDLQARIYNEGAYPMQIVADYCWNTRVKTDNRGFWAAITLGSTKNSRARFEYTYASVDREATVAAFSADDFRWGSGFEAHRGEVMVPNGPRTTLHAIAQLQRFKDSETTEEQEHWVRRFRVELRFTF